MEPFKCDHIKRLSMYLISCCKKLLEYLFGNMMKERIFDFMKTDLMGTYYKGLLWHFLMLRDRQLTWSCDVKTCFCRVAKYKQRYRPLMKTRGRSQGFCDKSLITKTSDNEGKGSNNCLKLNDVIYGRPKRPFWY